MRRIQNIFIAGMAAVALSVGAVGIAQAMGGESDTEAVDAQSDRAERAALEVVKRGEVVSVAHDNAGLAAWEVRVFKPTQALESFAKRPTTGSHIVVYLDRDYRWLQAKVEGYGPDPQK
jgi:hypothetical protein